MILDARVRAGWIEAPAPGRKARRTKRKARRPERRRKDFRLRARAPSDEGGSERPASPRGPRGRPRPCFASRSAGRRGRPRHPPQAPRSGRVDELQRRGGSPRLRQGRVRPRFPRQSRSRADLADAVDALLERDALQSLAIANKAGLVVAGAFKVDAASNATAAAALIQASDGAADGAAKREQALRAGSATPPRLWRGSISSLQVNWVWHWGRQM